MFRDGESVQLFLYNRITDRHALSRFRLTLRMGLFPLLVTLVMMFAMPAGPGPDLWCMFGLTIGLELILWGAHALHREPAVVSRWGNRLKATSDAWYPLLVFSVQNLFILLTIAVFWLTLRKLGGVLASPWVNINILLLALLIPAHRFAKELMSRTNDLTHVFWEKACRYLMVILGTTLAMAFWLDYVLPQTGPIAPELMFRILILSVSASLVILVCVALLLDFWFRRKNTPGVK